MDKIPQTEERRKFPRVPINVTIAFQISKPAYVKILLGRDEEEARALDISEGGMAFLAENSIPTGTPLSVEFMLYEPGSKNDFVFYKDIKAEGEVRHCQGEAGQYRIGISFTKIDDEDKYEIMHFVRQGISTEKP